MDTARDQSPSEAVLLTRAQARQVLGGVSTMTLIRMEQRGELKPIRLNKRSKTAMVFYRASDLAKLVNQDADNNDAA